MHTSPCLEAKEGDCSKHKHLKPAGKPVSSAVVWSIGSVFCHQPQSQWSRFCGSAFRDAVYEEKSVSGINLEQLYFSVVTSQKTLHCIT